MHLKDIKENLENFIQDYILISPTLPAHIPAKVVTAFQDYRSEITDNNFLDWNNDVYFEEVGSKYDRSEEPGEGQHHIKLIRIIYEKSDSLQYCCVKAFQEEYLFSGQDGDLQIEEFRFNEYSGIEIIRHHQLNLFLEKHRCPKFEYILKAKVQEECKYLFLILNDHFDIVKLPKTIKKVRHLHNYLLIDLGETNPGDPGIEISIQYRPRTLNSGGIFYIDDDNELFLASVCGFFPTNIKAPLHIKIKHETDTTVIVNGKSIKRKNKIPPDPGSIDAEFSAASTQDLCLYISRVCHTKEVEDRHVRIYAQRNDAANDLPGYNRILRFYEKYHQAVDDRECLKIVETPRLIIDGLSFPGVILLNTRLNRQHEIDKINIAAHEMAHQWWGYHVKFKGSLKNWLKESFPEYLKNLFIKEKYGIDFFKYQMREAAAFYLALKQCQQDIPIARAVESENIHDGLIYGKGVYVIHMLAQLTGQEILREVIRKFIGRGGMGAGKVQDFEIFHKILEAEAGKSFEWFFLQWLFEPGCPCLDINYSFEYNRLNLNITQRKSLYKFPLEISLIHTSGEKTDERVWISQQNEKIIINTAGKIERIIIDPGNDLLQMSHYFLSAAQVILGINQDDKQKKESELQQAVQFDPANIKALYFLMEFYHRQRKYKKCRELYEHASTLHDPLDYFKPKIEALFKHQI